MAFEFFRGRGRNDVKTAVSDLPTSSRRLVEQGLSALSRLPQERWHELLSETLESFTSYYAGDAREFAAKLGVSVDDSAALVHSTSFVVTLIGAFPEISPERFADDLVQQGVVESSGRDVVCDFASFVSSERKNVEDEVDRRMLESEVLPSLQRFETSVDLRFGERADGTPQIAPVIVAMLDTDAEGQLLWFQLSKRQLLAVITQLQTSLDRLEKAEAWANAQRQA